MDQNMEGSTTRKQRKIFFYKMVILLILFISQSDILEFKMNDWHRGQIHKMIPSKLMKFPVQFAVLLIPILMRLPELPEDCTTFLVLVLNVQILNLIIVGINMFYNCNIVPERCYNDYDGVLEESYPEALMWTMIQVLMATSFCVIIWLLKNLRKAIKTAIVRVYNWLMEDLAQLVIAISYLMVALYYKIETIAIILILGQMFYKMAVEWYLGTRECGRHDSSTPAENCRHIYDIVDPVALRRNRRRFVNALERLLNIREQDIPVQ